MHSSDGYLRAELWFYRPPQQEVGREFVVEKVVVLRHVAVRVAEPPL